MLLPPRIQGVELFFEICLCASVIIEIAAITLWLDYNNTIHKSFKVFLLVQYRILELKHMKHTHGALKTASLISPKYRTIYILCMVDLILTN